MTYGKSLSVVECLNQMNFVNVIIGSHKVIHVCLHWTFTIKRLNINKFNKTL